MATNSAGVAAASATETRPTVATVTLIKTNASFKRFIGFSSGELKMYRWIGHALWTASLVTRESWHLAFWLVEAGIAAASRPSRAIVRRPGKS
jgi:hypothetical protein